MDIRHYGGNANLEIQNGTMHDEDTREFCGRYKTFCCGLGQLSLSDDHSLEFIQAVVAKLKEENSKPVSPIGRDGGERAYFVMTLESEKDLEENLEKAGFTHLTTIHRRNYKPEDSMLKMWMISW